MKIITKPNDYVDNNNKKYGKTNSVNIGGPTSFRIKSHPEDNQGYPEERNMDYDPDDINCYPDDDLPYEGMNRVYRFNLFNGIF